MMRRGYEVHIYMNTDTAERLEKVLSATDKNPAADKTVLTFKDFEKRTLEKMAISKAVIDVTVNRSPISQAHFAAIIEGARRHVAKGRDGTTTVFVGEDRVDLCNSYMNRAKPHLIAWSIWYENKPITTTCMGTIDVNSLGEDQKDLIL